MRLYTVVAYLITAPIIQSNYKNINSILVGLKALNTVKHFTNEN